MSIFTLFGNITNPFKRINPSSELAKNATPGFGLISILNTLLKTSIVIGGLFVLFNIIIAGYTFLGAGGDPKKVQQAWEKIYLSLIGLLVIAGSLVLAGIVGFIVFGDATILIVPRAFEPK